MNDFLTGLLVNLWDKFKAKNAKLATLIILILGTVLYFADQGTLLGIIAIPENVSSVLKWLATALLALQGSRTTDDLKNLNK
tara:strand:+ start:2309 stop:2554 length:246 start_codon:yes stop_codon:yes gene_type:complete